WKALVRHQLTNSTNHPIFSLDIRQERAHTSCRISRGEELVAQPTDLLQGTLDLLILKTLALEPMHGWGIAQRIQQISRDVLQVQQASLYPPCTGWSSKVGSPPSGARRRTTAAP